MAKKQKLSKEELINEWNKLLNQQYDLEVEFKTFVFEIPFLPPTTNKAFFNTKFGRAKTTIANTFQNKVKQHIVENYSNSLNEINPNSLYKINYEFYFHWPKLFNINYPKTKTPYKMLDTDNRIKLLKDIFVKSVGIFDDTQIFKEEISKVGTAETSDEKAIIVLKPVTISEYIHIDMKNSVEMFKHYLDFYKKGIKTI